MLILFKNWNDQNEYSVDLKVQTQINLLDCLLKNRIGKMYLNQLLMLIFTFCSTVQLNGQMIVKIDSCLNRNVLITSAGEPNTFYMLETIDNHPVARRKAILKKMAYNNSIHHDEYSKKLSTFFFELDFNKYNYSDSIKIKQIKDSFYNCNYIDTTTFFNFLGDIIRLEVIENSERIEELHFNGCLLNFHSKIVKGWQYDTTFYNDGFESITRNKKRQTIKISNYQNGQSSTIEIDKRRTFAKNKPFPLAKYINNHTHTYLNRLEETVNQTNIEIQVKKKRQFLLSKKYINNDNTYFTETYLIERKSLFNKKGRIPPNESQLKDYRCLKYQYFNQNNELIYMSQFNKKGFQTLHYQKYLNEDIYQKDFNLNLYLFCSKGKLSYRSDFYKGSFTNSKKTITGSDTFYNNEDTVISKLLIIDNQIEYTRFLNGQFLLKGIVFCHYCDESSMKYLIGEEKDYAGNEFIREINYLLHHNEYSLNELDSISIGKDSILQQRITQKGTEVNLLTPSGSKNIFSNQFKHLKIFKDQTLCTIGAEDDSGHIVIPFKYDEISIFWINENLAFYICNVKTWGSLIDNEGKQIIKSRKGLTSNTFTFSKKFQRKHNLLYPYLFICNDVERDSFELVSLNDEVVISGKGQIEVLNRDLLKIKINGHFNYLHKDGEIIGDDSIGAISHSSELFFLKIETKNDHLRQSFWDTNNFSNEEKQQINHFYKIKDLNNGILDGEIFEKTQAINGYMTLLKKPGQTLFIDAKSVFYKDTSNIEAIESKDRDYIDLIHYNRHGLLKPNSKKIIPLIYNLISISNDIITGQTDDRLDVYNTNYDLIFSIPITGEQKSTYKGVRPSHENELIQSSPRNKIKLYKIKIGDKFGLFDSFGQAILEPVFEVIKIENRAFNKNYLFYQYLELFNDDCLLKTYRNNSAELFALQGNKISKLTSKVLWELRSNAISLLIMPNGKSFQEDIDFDLDYKLSKVTIYNKKSHSIKSEMDILGNEIFNGSRYLELRTIDKVNYVRLKNGKCGTLDCGNKIEIEPIYSELCLSNQKQLLWYKYGYPNEKWKLKILKNNTLMSDSFDFPVETTNWGFIDERVPFAYIKDSKFGLMSQNGSIILAPEYDHFLKGTNNRYYLLSKDNVLYAWNENHKTPIKQAYQEVYSNTIVNNRINSYQSNYCHSYNGHKMYMFNSDFIASDSSDDLFFNRNYDRYQGPRENDFSSNSFVYAQKENIDYINSMIGSTYKIEWMNLNPLASFPPSMVRYEFNQLPIKTSNATAIHHIKFNDYTKLDYTYLKDKGLKNYSNGPYTLSLIAPDRTRYLNIYIDSFLGYLEFNLRDMFKGKGADSLTEIIKNSWKALKDPNLPCLAGDKILDHLTIRFSIDNDQIKFHLESNKAISIPISELKPYMTEFWQNRF